MKLPSAIVALGALATTARAAPTLGLAGREPTVEANSTTSATVTVDTPAGSIKGASFLGIESFRAIPYAEPPTGQRRLRPPKRLESTLEDFDATGIAPACPQMYISSEATDIISEVLGSLLDMPFLKPLSGQEDCLTVTVQRPAGVKEGDKLPVLFWIFGGGFQLGSSSTYDATDLLSFAGSQDQPFIFVSVNYRVGGFGFLPGAEILADGSANLGLLDQRMGLEWVADNIAAFGGDPDKVTLWGQSAGSVSVFDQMALYGGNATYKDKPLFRGAIMSSGSTAPAFPVDDPKGQEVYDRVVDRAGCADSQDTLACLREVDYETLHDATNSVPSILSYNALALSYLPRPDGDVLPDSPDVLSAQGRYHAVPMIIGSQEDEGTLFALFQSNLSTTEDFAQYFSDLYFPNATIEELTTFVETYDPAKEEGSPFRTGRWNELYPGYKRLAAMLGDLVFTLTRRLFLGTATTVKPNVPAWSYLSSYNYGTPILGTLHSSDLLQVFYGVFPNHAARSSRTYFFNFLHNLDPNVGVEGYDTWPEWRDNKELMWFETADENSILLDDFRADSEQWISNNVARLRV